MTFLSNLLKQKPLFLLSVAFFISLCVSAQTKVLKGSIRDQHSGEQVPFASVRFKNSGIGKLSDSAGQFVFHFNQWPKDTLQINFVGFKDYEYAFEPLFILDDTLNLLVNMEAGKYDIGVVVRTKTNRGLLMWRRIVQHKPEHNRYKFSN